MKQFHTIFLLFSVLIAACATSPSGRRQLMIVSEESAIAASKQAYVEMLKPYAQKGKIDNNPGLKDRVYRITGRLIAQAVKMRPETKDWDWSIKIIDDPETVNAWAMAGGKMALYSGLVVKLKPTDDELAQVLALLTVLDDRADPPAPARDRRERPLHGLGARDHHGLGAVLLLRFELFFRRTGR